jgi:LPXTG-motif cell wall-anchored protein
MEQTTLLLWAGLTAVVVVAVVLVRYKRRKRLDIELSEFIGLVAAVLGVVSSCQLLYKAFTLQALQDLLGQDIVTLIIGAIAVIWVSAKEVWKALI